MRQATFEHSEGVKALVAQKGVTEQASSVAWVHHYSKLLGRMTYDDMMK